MKTINIGFIMTCLILLFLAGCTQQGGGNYGARGGTGVGRMVVTIADKAADLGAVSSIQVTVNRVMVHSTTNGWVTISSTPMTFDLLKLKASGTQALLADTNISKGDYDQLSLEISNVVVTDATGIHTAKLPSGDLKITGVFFVGENTTSAATFDFIADRSLHITGDGKYILAPVIHLQTKDYAQVDDSNEANVRINSGNIRADEEAGMDENGTIGVGVEIPSDANISIDEAGSIHVDRSSRHGNGPANGNANVSVRVGY